MSLVLYAHPFSAYCQKVLIAFYETAVPFTVRQLGPEDPQAMATLTALWPLKRFPILVDDGRCVVESSIIIEHCDLNHRGAVRMVPEDARTALEVRLMDRFFDNYVATPLQRIVFDSLRPAETRDTAGVADARGALETAYRWLDARMADRPWAAGEDFTLADCAAAPALFYADWTHRIDASFTQLHAFRQRLLRRPSVARAVDEARPYRSLFPLGAPDRD